MHSKSKLERHEYLYGPHFNKECAVKAVSKMHNTDGTRGPHWDLIQTTRVAEQYGINTKTGKFNEYDWYVALNMVRSDYYKFVFTTFHSDNIKYFVGLAKAFLEDDDVDEGKMWYYYKYVMCDVYHEEEEDYDEEDDEDYLPVKRALAKKAVPRKYKDLDYDDEDAYKIKAAIYRRDPRYTSRY